MRLVTFSILMLGHLFAFAQNSLSGKIIDPALDLGLKGANIRLTGPANKATASGNAGEFQFTNLPSGEYELLVTYVGYGNNKQTISVPFNGSLEINMEEDLFLDDKVIVTATRASEKTPLTYSEVKKVDLEETNMGKDMPYLLENTPSVVTTSDGGSGVGYTGIRIRGSDPTRVNVTINGIPYNDTESQGVFWVNLPDFASSVESIQVQRGVGTSTNGASAFGATVNVQTNGLNKDAYATIDNAFGSFNTRKHTVNAGTGLLNNAFTVDARLSKIYTDGYLDRATADLNAWYVSAGYYGKSTLLKFNIFSGQETTYQAWYGTPESRVRNDEQGMQDYIARNGLTAAEADNLLNSGRTYNYYTYDNQVDDYQQTHYQLLFSQDISESFLVNAALHYTRGQGYFEQYEADQNLSDYGFEGPNVGGIVVDTTDLIRRRWLDNHFYGFTFSGHYNPSSSMEIILGGAWNKYDGDHFGEIIWAEVSGNAKIRDRYYDNNGLKTDFNIYAKGSFDLTKDLTAFADIQYRGIDYTLYGLDNDGQFLDNNYTFQFVNPKVGLTYFLDNNQSIYASYSVGNKEPARSDFIDNTNGITPTHDTLHDIEVGFRKTKSKLQMNTNFYYMGYKNQLVLTGELNDVGASLRANVPRSYRAGIELDMGYQFTPKIMLSANATFSKNIIDSYTETLYDYGPNWDEFNIIERTFENTNISFSPEIIAGGTIRYTPIEGLNLAWVHKYVGEQYLDNTSDETRKIDGYYISDIRANYSFIALGMKQLSINVAVYNVFNNFYEANGYTYGYLGGGAEIRENFFYPQAGTNFMAGLTLKF